MARIFMTKEAGVIRFEDILRQVYGPVRTKKDIQNLYADADLRIGIEADVKEALAQGASLPPVAETVEAIFDWLCR